MVAATERSRVDVIELDGGITAVQARPSMGSVQVLLHLKRHPRHSALVSDALVWPLDDC